MASSAIAPPTSAAIRTGPEADRSPERAAHRRDQSPDERCQSRNEGDRGCQTGPDPDDLLDEDGDVRTRHLRREEGQPEDGEDPTDDPVGQDAADGPERQ